MLASSARLEVKLCQGQRGTGTKMGRITLKAIPTSEVAAWDAEKADTGESLITTFDKLPRAVSITISGGKTDAICVSEVTLGLYEQKRVLHTGEFFLEGQSCEGVRRHDRSPHTKCYVRTKTFAVPSRKNGQKVLEATICDRKRVAAAKAPGENPRLEAFMAINKTDDNSEVRLAWKGQREGKRNGDPVRLQWKAVRAEGVLRLEYKHHEGGICISELRTVDAETFAVLRTWTLVPFWLDKKCDGGDNKYYHGDGNEGQLRCWGTTREFGAGFEDTRAISVTTCDDSTKLAGTKGNLKVTVTMKDDYKTGRVIPNVHDNDLESSVVLSGYEMRESQKSIAEEELDRVTLALVDAKAEKLQGQDGVCISKLVYESVVLANSDFL
eukprot:g12738.t1